MINSLINQNIKPFPIKDRWCVHAYYTLCPYAPDNSGRIVIAGADLDNNFGEIYILSGDGEIIDRFGHYPLSSAFFHTGYWQTWSHDCKYIFFQGGTPDKPEISTYEISTGKIFSSPGCMEGAPPFDSPIPSGLMGMLYASGYGDGNYYPELSPVPFQKRDEHGLFESDVFNGNTRLVLSVNDILKANPDRSKLEKFDEEIKNRLGEGEAATLMVYCVRWNRQGTRALVYFGNHCTAKSRGEPRIAYIYTFDREYKELHMALNLTERSGVHWSWHPDGEHIIGYVDKGFGQVRYDGSGFKMISNATSSGHPSINPCDYNVYVTDVGEKLMMISLLEDTIIKSYNIPVKFGDTIPVGRNPKRICIHPVFSQDGKKILINSLPGKNSVVCEIEITES